MRLSKLKKSFSELTPEERLHHIRQVRMRRVDTLFAMPSKTKPKTGKEKRNGSS